ncbi:MAG: DMT family transporter [Candidatus Thermoplasmatota archaeon]|nr:DMT family transporter [Candidatus Thermoplasmatota archaeon]
MKERSRAYLLGITAVLIWSTVASVFKITLRSTDPFSMVLIASVVSTFTLMLVLIFKGKLKKLGELPKRSIFKALALGSLNPFLYYIVLFSAYDILKAQEAQALNYTWPIMLTVLSILVLRQRTTKLQISAVLMSFFGIVVISSRGSFFLGSTIAPWGILLGLFSAAIWATFWTLDLRSSMDDDVKLFLNFLSGTILIAILVVSRGGINLEGVDGITGSIYIGLFEMGITFIIWFRALRVSGTASKISNLIYLSPFLSLFLIQVIVGEPILATTLIGLALIMAGVVLQRYDDRSGKDPAP